MNINLICPVIVLENELNPNIRKNDIKKFKVLVDSKFNLLSIKVKNASTLKEIVRTKISNIIGSNQFHLEQVYTLGEERYYIDNDIDIIYLAVTNIENVKKLDSDYRLVDFEVKNDTIIFNGNSYKFKTKERIVYNNIEYYHEIKAENIKLEKKLLELLIAYKYIRARIDNTDILFKFMPEYFTLEELRIVYEMIKETSVDKSNFRKKIVKYCEEADVDITKKGYRPSKMYIFKALKGDIWL